MHLRGINVTQFPTRPTRPFLKKTIYYKPNDVSLKKSNELLYTFAYTRHPFRRLVSGYHDKALKHGKEKIMNKYRQLHQRNSHDILTPKIFVNYLLAEANQHGPIFLNGIYRPQYAICPFCSLNFNYVGEIEDMDTHMKYLAERFGLPVILGNNISLLE